MLTWPPNSPDFNPVERLWDVLLLKIMHVVIMLWLVSV